MKISQLSKTTGVSARSIRHYEKKKLITPARLDNEYREFDDSAVDRIKTIQFYLRLGLTTKQIEEILNCDDAVPEEYEFCEEMLEAYQKKLDEINRQMNTLATVKDRLEQQIDQMKEKRSEKNPKVFL